MIFLKTLVLSLVLLNTCSVNVEGGETFDYQENGPDTWHNFHADCGLTEQSPIDIVTSQLEVDSTMKNMKFVGYNNKSLEWSVTKNSHNVGFSLINGEAPYFTETDTSDQFALLGGHFHWGYNNEQGSEHTVNGQKFPLEMHLIHENQDSVIHVFGFLFELSENNNVDLDELINAISNVEQSGDQMIKLYLPRILPKNLSKFYRYNGSFTTPPCTENVRWTIFQEPIRISESQMKAFHDLEFIKLNFRDTQKINSRKVRSSY